MKFRSLLLGLIAVSTLSARGQEVDVTKLVADTKTFIFDNNKNTVKGYIYAELETKTTCCGTDRIYLKVDLDPSGYVISASTLTGKNECIKSSVIDIVKNIKWDTRDFKGPRPVYFEVSPQIDCEAGRTNVYAALPVFNNPIAKGTTAPATAAVTPSAPQNVTRSETPAATQPTVVTPPATQPAVVTAPAATKPAVVTQPAVVTPPVTTPAAPVSAQPDPAATTAASTPMVSTAATNPTTSAANEEELREARQRADAERVAQEQEIQQLKAQMQKMREEEEKKRQQALAAEKARKEKEEQQIARSSGGGAGGLFLDDQDPKAPKGSKAQPTDPPAKPQTDEERYQEELKRLEAQKQEIENARRQRDDETRRRQVEDQKSSDDLLRIEEQITRTQEQAAQRREQQELDRLEADRVKAEEARRKEEEAYSRMMSEIQRLQDEANRKIAEMEQQKRDLDNLANLKRAREQEIMLERALRDQESQKRLEEVRLSLASSGQNLTVMSDAASPATGVIPDLSTRSDSEKLQILTQTVNQLQRELSRLQEQIRLMGGVPATAPVVTSGSRTKPAATVSGDRDQSWKGIDYTAPNTDPSVYVVNSGSRPAVKTETRPATPATPEAGYQPGQGYRPDPSHSDTHANMAGPEFSTRTYVDGNEKMKELVKNKLKEGGVCGLGQAVFSVTLDPSGKVLRHTVLAANTPAVELQINSIIPTLRFNAIDSRYNQTVYLEFKADIICAGAADKVNLKEVESIIKD